MMEGHVARVKGKGLVEFKARNGRIAFFFCSGKIEACVCMNSHCMPTSLLINEENPFIII